MIYDVTDLDVYNRAIKALNLVYQLEKQIPKSHFKLAVQITSSAEGIDVLLDGRIDDFIGDCGKCGRFFDIGAKIVKGQVKNVWILKEKS